MNSYTHFCETALYHPFQTKIEWIFVVCLFLCDKKNSKNRTKINYEHSIDRYNFGLFHFLQSLNHSWSKSLQVVSLIFPGDGNGGDEREVEEMGDEGNGQGGGDQGDGEGDEGEGESEDEGEGEGEESMDNQDVQLDHSLGYDCTRR